MKRRKRREEILIAEGVVVTLSGIAHGGEAVGRHEGEAAFVVGGIPGEEVKVDLYRERRKLVRGVIREILVPSPDRVSPPCPYFGWCGGCQWQHIAYERQLELKARIVTEQLQHLGGFSEPPVLPTIPSPQQWYYRNHVRFSTGRHGHLGFMRPSSHRFLAIDRCLISHPVINEMLSEVQGRGAGLHQVVMRVGHHTGERLIYPRMLADGEPAANELHEKLGGKNFHISLSSFFQVNTEQAEQLVQIVIDRLGLRGHETVLDAYCGVGTFAILIAGQARLVIGIEESRSAIQDAERNALGNDNVRFIAGKTEHVLPELREHVDSVVLDPARVGCAPDVLETLANAEPSTVVYVSCDPATLARDLRLLCGRGYRLVEVQPVDMFPQTYHIENVATLRRESP